MKPSLARKKISRAAARNAALLNLLGTPGLGSLLARRWFAGGGQLLLAVAGFALVVVWFAQEIIPCFGGLFSEQPLPPVNLKTPAVGAGLFASAWLWSLVTSLSLRREAASEKPPTLGESEVHR